MIENLIYFVLGFVVCWLFRFLNNSDYKRGFEHGYCEGDIEGRFKDWKKYWGLR